MNKGIAGIGRFASVSPALRFPDKVSAPDENGCTLWQASRAKNGYGEFWDGTRLVRAHRWAYEQVHGPIPAGLDLDHLCRNRACVTVSHLEPVTRQENARRGLWGRLRTHCIRGHLYTPENLIPTKNGWRQCRECFNYTARARAAARRAEKEAGK